MGLIKAVAGAISSNLKDQFKELIVCPTNETNVLIARGIIKDANGNNKNTEGVISNGSTIIVPEGYAMMLVDNGKIVEFSAEPGEFTYENSSEPSIFYGSLGQNIIDTIKNIGSRITYAGNAPKDQRVYYVNILNNTGNKFGTANPKKITDEKYGIIEVTFFGEYAYKVADPALLVASVIGANAKDVITFDEVMGSQLKQEFVEQLTQTISVIMREKKVSFGDMGLYGADISNEMNKVLSSSWKDKYGLIVTDVAMGDINVTDESLQRINRIDDAKIFSSSEMQSGLMASSTASALEKAAENDNGAMTGFMGMNMANNTGAGLMGAVNNSATTNPAPTGNANFCPNCGNATNGSNYCPNCGTKLK